MTTALITPGGLVGQALDALADSGRLSRADADALQGRALPSAVPDLLATCWPKRSEQDARSAAASALHCAVSVGLTVDRELPGVRDLKSSPASTWFMELPREAAADLFRACCLAKAGRATEAAALLSKVVDGAASVYAETCWEAFAS